MRKKSDSAVNVGLRLVLSAVCFLEMALAAPGQTPGALDSSFDPQIDGPVTQVVKQSDGKILVAGRFSTVNGLRRPWLARLQANGSIDPSFVADLNDYV